MNIMPKPNSNFTIIQNDIFNNYPDMSAKSKFMLLQILSKPADWKLSLSWLAKQNNEGIHAVKSSVREWQDNGFLHKFTARADGRIKEVVPVVCFPPLTREQAEVHFNVKCQQSQGQPEAKPVEPEIVEPEIIEPEIIEPVVCDSTIDETETCRQEINPVENHPAENHPLLPYNNKNKFKQTLRETTTTTPDPVPEPVIYDHDTLLPVPSSSYSTDEIIKLIPEQHRSPIVLSLVNKAMVDYPAREVEEAITYAGANVRGGSFQFRAYLDKTLKNKWAEGYLDTMEEPNFNRGYGAAWGHPMAKYPNGTVTGDPRMDTNYLVAADFLMEMGVDVDQMCAEA